ncbi:phosphogluconate dehydratase [Cedecea neteri]|uniref:Phosphogluconate dehydratase n=1 Tax=Cedecea neteri TaxID=158822 RepID=A0A2X3JDD9_9ENTR|nr:phosphogluconate dehydratase [Cedecea neteri]
MKPYLRRALAYHPDLSAERVGTGRELFGALREQLSGAEQGATCIKF